MNDIVLRAVPDPDDPDSFGPDENVRRRKADGRMPLWRQNDLIRELATQDHTRTEIATEFGCSRAYVTQFAKRYAYEIAKLRKNLDNEFAHVWAAQKINRILVRQKLIMETLAQDDRTPEDRRTVDQLMKSIAEELGQLPPRQIQATAQVVHQVVGVSNDELKASGLMP